VTSQRHGSGCQNFESAIEPQTHGRGARGCSSNAMAKIHSAVTMKHPQTPHPVTRLPHFSAVAKIELSKDDRIDGPRLCTDCYDFIISCWPSRQAGNRPSDDWITITSKVRPSPQKRATTKAEAYNRSQVIECEISFQVARRLGSMPPRRRSCLIKSGAIIVVDDFRRLVVGRTLSAASSPSPDRSVPPRGRPAPPSS
jgi:hypothetical protein